LQKQQKCEMKTLKLSMWSGPRNVSTALMYSFRQRSDTLVFDEPLYGHYLKVSGAQHPGGEEVLSKMDTDGDRVVREVLLATSDRPIRFYKNMAHHLLGLERDFLSQLTNILLTRDPREMLPSLSKQIPNPTLRDTGLREQVELLDFILQSGQTPIVLDAKELLQNPENVLREVCGYLGIPFEPAMLSWQAGPKPEDGVWAKHWYDNVHKSTTFEMYQAKQEKFPEHLKELLDQSLPIYERLYEYAIKSSS
jgi:Sulfotransferase domain